MSIAKASFSKVSLSGVTVARRIEELAADIDESMDMTDTAQLAIFIRGIDDNFEVNEEMAALYPMKGATKGCDILEGLMAVLNRFKLKFANLSGVITDDALAMVGKHEGLVALIKKSEDDLSLMQYHCIIHQQNLCAKSISFDEVMKVVIKVVNFIRSRGHNHQEFKNFLSEIYSEYGDVVHFSDVRWLSRGKMLEMIFDLKETI